MVDDSTRDEKLADLFDQHQHNPKNEEVRHQLLEYVLEFLYRVGKGMANQAGAFISGRDLAHSAWIKLEKALRKSQWTPTSKEAFLKFCEVVIRNLLLDRLRRRRQVMPEKEIGYQSWGHLRVEYDDEHAKLERDNPAAAKAVDLYLNCEVPVLFADNDDALQLGEDSVDPLAQEERRSKTIRGIAADLGVSAGKAHLLLHEGLNELGIDWQKEGPS